MSLPIHEGSLGMAKGLHECPSCGAQVLELEEECPSCGESMVSARFIPAVEPPRYDPPEVGRTESYLVLFLSISVLIMVFTGLFSVPWFTEWSIDDDYAETIEFGLFDARMSRGDDQWYVYYSGEVKSELFHLSETTRTILYVAFFVLVSSIVLFVAWHRGRMDGRGHTFAWIMAYIAAFLILIAVANYGLNISHAVDEAFSPYDPSVQDLGRSWYVVLIAGFICLLTAELIRQLKNKRSDSA
jgi:rRNA maturation protein Nop10